MSSAYRARNARSPDRAMRVPPAHAIAVLDVTYFTGERTSGDKMRSDSATTTVTHFVWALPHHFENATDAIWAWVITGTHIVCAFFSSPLSHDVVLIVFFCL